MHNGGQICIMSLACWKKIGGRADTKTALLAGSTINTGQMMGCTLTGPSVLSKRVLKTLSRVGKDTQKEEGKNGREDDQIYYLFLTWYLVKM